MNDKVNKKDNAFVRWTEKHAEFWKFIKFNCAGALSNVPEFATQLVLLYLVFKCADDPNARGTQISYYCSTFVGYAVAFILNRKITFHADANPFVSTVLYVLMVIFTIWAKGIIGPWVSNLTNDFLPGTVAPTVATLIGMGIPVIWTYPCNRFIIHRKKKPVQNEQSSQETENTEEN